MIDLSRFLSAKLRQFLKRSFTVLFITVNVTLIVINTIYIQRTLETQNENLVEMIEHLSVYTDDETVMTYLEHYGHTHAVTLRYESLDGHFIYETDVAPDNPSVYDVYVNETPHAVIEIDNAQSNIFWTNVFYVVILNVVVIGLYVIGILLFNNRLSYVEQTILKDVKTLQKSIHNVKFDDAVYFEAFKDVLNHFESTYETLKTTQKTYQDNQMTLAHDIKTPLMIIQGLIDGIESGRMKPEKAIFTSIDEEITRIDHLVKSMIEGAKQDVWRQFDLRETVETVVNAFKPLYDHQGTTLRVHEGDVFNVYGYPQDLRRVIDHVLLNSLKHTKRGDQAEVTFNQSEKTLTIQDSGEGMDQEALDALFDETADAYGSGVGLNIVKQILIRHHAEVVFNAEKGKGFMVRITFHS